MKTLLMILMLGLTAAVFGQTLPDKTEYLGQDKEMNYFVYPLEKKEDKVKFIGITSPFFKMDGEKYLIDVNNYSMIAFEGNCTTREVMPVANRSVKDGQAYKGYYDLPPKKVADGDMISLALDKACHMNWNKIKEMFKILPLGIGTGVIR